ncbi:transcription factor bHLH18-like [Gastrolobium bilobum]|uniref:transcription factor bHLH18-like n=1 Tax=Gastrolobium bilobum TaxID=150636 RepID=UPI002AAF8307|nr:transcription factor bHLH18-like [Gastrolobium bilobum]
MEQNPWGKWSSDLETDDHVNECLRHTNNPFDEEFLRDILQQPQEATGPVNNSSINMCQHVAQKPTTYILSFDKSTALLPNDNDSCSVWKDVSQSQLGNHNTDSLPLSSSKENPGTKKTRNASETLDHIMSERQRRRELTRKFIALSATIPGLKKMDKAHVLREAINYVKQLQERVKELEEDIQKNGLESVITITRSYLYIEDDTAFSETNTDECYGPNEALPEVEARVIGKEVLIKIQCGKQKGILLKILSQLEGLHLSICSSNVLPFGDTLDITIIAQMGDKYSLIVKDLVKKLRLVAMLKSCEVR